MRKENICLLLSLALLVSSCQTPTAREIARFNGRPDFEVPCIANGDGTCYQDGELMNTTNMICGSTNAFNQVQDWIEFLEFSRYKCLKYGRCK